MLALIVERARELLATDLAWLALAEDDRVRVQIAAGATTEGIARMEVALGTRIGGIALLEGRTIIVGDQALYGNGMPRTVHEALEADGVVSVMCARRCSATARWSGRFTSAPASKRYSTTPRSRCSPR